MNRRPILTAWFAVWVILGSTAQPALAADLTADAALAAARAATRYMISAETEEGRFLYQFDFLLGRFVDGDNIVRQAGAGYSLNQYVFLTLDPAVLEPGRRATAYAAARSVPWGGGKLVSTDGSTAKASIGGTALAALGAIYGLRLQDQPALRGNVQSWIDGLISSQLPNGAFPSAPGKSEQDSYGSGEAWLALAHWAAFNPGDAEAGAALRRADQALLAYYSDTPNLQFFHWGLQAAAKRLESTGDTRFVQFIKQQLGAYLDRLVPQPRPNANSCAAVEGLVAAVGALGRASDTDAGLVARVQARIELELNKSLALQIKPKQDRVSFDANRYYSDPKISNFAGGFLDNALELQMRIDSTQHCLSALLAYWQVLSP